MTTEDDFQAQAGDTSDNWQTRVRAHIREYAERFAAAIKVLDWPGAESAWRHLLRTADAAISDVAAARIEAAALATELALYRPTRAAQPPAPQLDGYTYVATAGAWVCAAVEHRTTVWIPTLGAGYAQEHYVPDKKTVCGKKVTFPIHERFASGGWPRLRELCPECLKALAKLLPPAAAS